MRDCLMRAGYHPVGTPSRHHAERRCAGCRAVGCVVPRCPHHRFLPRQPDTTWRDLAVGRGAESLWRCSGCSGVRTTLA